jgi:hypothetical protein
MLIKQFAQAWVMPQFPGSYVNEHGDIIEGT